MSAFEDGFRAAHLAAEKAMGEKILVDGREYPVISIDLISLTDRGALGGRFEEASTTVYLRTEIFTATGLRVGKILTALGQDLRMIDKGVEGDGAINVVCGPAGLEAGFL